MRPTAKNGALAKGSSPAQAREWAAECLERALNDRVHPESRMLLLDTAEAWIRLADRIESLPERGATHAISPTVH